MDIFRALKNVSNAAGGQKDYLRTSSKFLAWWIPLASGIYIAMFTIAWAKYEFAFDRAHKQFIMLTELILSGNKEAERMLSHLTREKYPPSPGFYDFRYVYELATKKNIDAAYLKFNQALIDDVAEFLKLRPSLEGMDLDNMILIRADLKHVNFSGASLRHARFSFSDLKGAKFAGADLTGAVFFRSKCEETDFYEARLDGADFHWADLSRADLIRTSLYGAYFAEARMDNADLKDAVLGGMTCDESKELRSDCSLYNEHLVINDHFYQAAVARFYQRFRKAKGLKTIDLPKYFKRQVESAYPGLLN